MNDGDVRKALRKLMTENLTLTALLSSSKAVYYKTAPQGGVMPYVIFDKQSGLETYAFKGKAYKNQLWQVKGVCRGGDPEVAELIDSQCAEVLNDSILDIEDATTMVLYRESDISLVEAEPGGELVHSVGGSYRVVIQPL